MKKKFIVIKSTPSNEGKTFLTKLQRETTVDHPIFGLKTKKETYFISGSKQVPVDTEVELNPEDYRIGEYPFSFVNEAGETVETMQKYLHLK